MKIVQLITRMDTIGGAQTHLKDICISLKQSGYSIQVITGGTQNIFIDLEDNRVPIIYCNHLFRNIRLFSDIKALYELRNLIKRINPDIIATHSSKAGILGRIVGKSLRIPTVFTAHGWAFTDGVSKKKRQIYMLIEKLIGFISDGVITVSHYDKRLALNNNILPEKKMVTIHNGVHEIEHRINNKSKEGIVNLIMVARFSSPKKQLYLIQILSKIKELNWKMIFVGDGEMLSEAKEYVDKNLLNERIEFLGNRKNVDQILRNSHVFILLSDWEGLPLSILEAMSCGLPIIASDVGGVKEAVKQSENGFLINNEDEHDVINKLTLLLSNPQLRITMGNASRSFYEERFTFNIMIEKTYGFYEKIIASKLIKRKRIQ